MILQVLYFFHATEYLLKWVQENEPIAEETTLLSYEPKKKCKIF